MTTMTRFGWGIARTLASLSVAAVLTAFSDPSMAQDGQQSSPANSGDSAGAEDEFGKPKAQVAQVGAGTTNGSTTGFSGPESNVQAAPGENSLPPLPSANMCEPYRDTPAYEACLWVVLRQDLGGSER